MSPTTIYALSSGGLPSGVAVIRLSGPVAIEVAESLSRKRLVDRELTYCVFRSPEDESVIDRGLVAVFRGPASFTGEDSAELHLHGGVAVVARMLDVLSDFDNCDLAEPGEFSRRAFDNGKLDLSEAEGLADLISADTEAQRQMAVRQAGGVLKARLEDWRGSIIKARAYIEAEFDFSDEEDVPDSMQAEVVSLVETLSAEISSVLESGRSGEIIRNGFRVALLGPPNAGKSSLLNALADREAAIVSPTPGTTRDVIEVAIDIEGIPVIFSDTAGIRSSADDIEVEGIRRSINAARAADCVLWLQPVGELLDVPEGIDKDLLTIVRSKWDLAVDDREAGDNTVSLDVRSVGGLDRLVSLLSEMVSSAVGGDNSALINRKRHRIELQASLDALKDFLKSKDDLVLASEHLRVASHHLGRLTGSVDVEDLLDVVFGEFCIGK